MEKKALVFKSVFGVAKSVEIHSNGFDFKLYGEKPTIPEKCENNSEVVGTKMIYDLKNPMWCILNHTYGDKTPCVCRDHE